MAVSQDLFGITYQIPQSDEEPWGTNVTAIIVALADYLDSIGISLSGQGIQKLPSTTTIVAGATTLSVTHPRHRVIGNGGPVTMSATNALSDGLEDGHLVTVLGISDTETVTILDGARTKQNGNVTLGLGSQITYCWDQLLQLWIEIGRTV